MSSTPIVINVDAIWTKFDAVDNEMMVTKAGRCLFPALDYTITGLQPDSKYSFEMQLEQMDDFRYQYEKGNGRWLRTSNFEKRAKAAVVVPHPDGAKLGSEWMEDGISFEFLKITNNPKETRKNYIIVNSMHKYMPVLSVHKWNYNGVKEMLVGEMRMDFTKFITVTGYQNPVLKQMKIESNPASSSRRERKRPAPTTNITQKIEVGEEQAPPQKKFCQQGQQESEDLPDLEILREFFIF